MVDLNLFGYQIKKKVAQEDNKKANSPILPTLDDGAIVINSGASHYSTVLDLDGTIKGENDLIRRYRECAMYSDVDSAIEDIVNEAISSEDDDEPVIKLDLEELKIGDGIKKKIEEEFDNITTLLKFRERSHEIFRQWYIDGRIYYHMLLDKDTQKDGIKELRYIDPRKIRKIKNIIKEKTATGVEIVKVVEEYYMYSERGVSDATGVGIKMSLDSVVYVPSGNFDANTGIALSFLHKAVKPSNQLKMVEDAMVIYRITRAPERRIFYIDVGNLPKQKAEQYVIDTMNKFKNKIVYGAVTGEIKDDRKHISMMEDIWMPRRDGSKGTEITTLPGLQSVNATDDVNYLQTKLFQALNVPLSRLQQGGAFSLGRSSEITRDEIKFAKFVARLRTKFSQLFLDLLRVQLVAKAIIRADEWEDMRVKIKLIFAKDNHFAEFKQNEIMTQRINLLTLMDPFVAKYYSKPWVQKNVLKLSEDELKEIAKEQTEELDNNPPPPGEQTEVPQ